MAVVAGGAKRFVGDDLVLNAVLRNVHQGLRLFRSQPVIGGQSISGSFALPRARASAPFSRTMRLMASSHPSGVVRSQEMRGEVALVVLLMTCAAA